MVRTNLLLIFRYLPILLVTFIGFLAGAFANAAMFSLFLGHVFVVPILTFFLRLIPFPSRVPWSDTGNLFPSHATQITHVDQPTITTYWMSHIVFFFTYIFLNALAIYQLPVDPNASAWMVTNRKTKLVTIMAVLCIVFIAITFARYTTTGVESGAGLLVALFVFTAAGYGWYTLVTRCGLKHGDMFGIVNQILPSAGKEDVPMTCVYAPEP